MCTRSGQVLEDYKGKSVFHLIAERAAEMAKKRNSLPAPSEAVMRKAIARTIGLPEAIAIPKKPHVDEFAKMNMALVTEPGIEVRGTWHPTGKADPTVVYVHGLGRNADTDAIDKLVKSGYKVFAVDLRGFGDTAPSVPNLKPGAKPGPVGNDFRESFLALHINRPLLGQRTYDLLAVVAYLKKSSVLPVHLVGVGAAGPIVLHAAALDPDIKSVTIEDSLISWTAVTRAPINYNQLTNVVPGALALYDLPELAAFIAPRPLTVRNAVDPLLEPVAQATLAAAYAKAELAYESRGAGKNLRLQGK